LPCSSDHFTPVLDEINARADLEAAPTNPENAISEDQRQSAAKNAGRGWGGRRRGAGAPKGNLNAFKHGRTARRQAQILEAMAQVPGVQQALIDLAKQRAPGGGSSGRRGLPRRACGGGVLDYFLDCSARLRLYNQDFLAYLNETSAQIRALLEKRSSPRRTTIKRPSDAPGGQA
jgi:hypothetical protein